jgi:hypothetical protein
MARSTISTLLLAGHLGLTQSLRFTGSAPQYHAPALRQELPASTVQNWRVAPIKALGIEENWQDVRVIDSDLEAHLAR